MYLWYTQDLQQRAQIVPREIWLTGSYNYDTDLDNLKNAKEQDKFIAMRIQAFPPYPFLVVVNKNTFNFQDQTDLHFEKRKVDFPKLHNNHSFTHFKNYVTASNDYVRYLKGVAVLINIPPYQNLFCIASYDEPYNTE